MAFGLIIIGDEILSGRRQDQHFGRVRELLVARGLGLAWVSYLGDERGRIAETLARSFAGGDIVFCTGGIGATPDDHTRQAAAEALGVPLALHPEAARLITERTLEVGLPVTPERLRMGEFPAGAELIPNPYNRIPGFSLADHHFVPGFPQMAWPMLEWVLERRYAGLFHAEPVAERSLLVRGLAEATLTPLMEAIERNFPGVRVFSLPRLDPERRTGYEIDLGVKGRPDAVDAAFRVLREGAGRLGGVLDD
ncbi:MAG: molybdopterin-binding protein [Thiobacillaceae bacterium]|jgi:molybdopterin-biosynthesis enzyme MoeA-like protein|nr:molybdopterin-binding protein [Thiobacillaceae bacterium]